MAFKMNTIKYDLCSYPSYVIMGQRGIGKSTLFRDIVLKEYKSPEFGLLISCGNESGYHAIDNLQVEEAREWTKELGYPEKENGVPEDQWTRGFVEVIDDLVLNKNNYKIKLVCIDTIDELYPMAEQRVFVEHKRKKGTYPESLNSALGGYGAGQNRTVELVSEQISRLFNAGYGVFIIGHVKVKDKIDPVTGDIYEQYTNNLSNKYFGAIADNAQMVVNIVNELNIVGSNVADNKAGRLEGASRMMYFRDTGLIDAKSRFVGMPDKLPLSADNFLKAFEEGVKNSQTVGNPLTAKEVAVKKEDEVKEKKQTYKNVVKAEESDDRRRESLADEIKSAMKNVIKGGGSDTVTALQQVMKEYGLTSQDDIGTLKISTMMDLLHSINKLS